MYIPKPITVLTIKREVIEVYDYIVDPIFVKLANDVVIGINPDTDQISFLTIDEKGIYSDMVSAFVQKPTLGHIELAIDTRKLTTIKSYSKNRKIDYDSLPIDSDLLELHLSYFHRNKKEQ